MKYKIVSMDEDDIELFSEKLNEFTDAIISFEDAAEDELVVFKAEDGQGKIIAGCNLDIYRRKAADLDILWVDEQYRKQGLGSALIRKAERAAKERGCPFMTLGTFDFQARPFYEKHGFTVCGTLGDCPRGHEHFDMIKRLDRPSAEYAPSRDCAFEIKPGSEDDAEFIDDRLCEYNWSKVPKEHGFRPIGKKMLDDGGSPVAGCCAGVNFWNIAFIDLMWVDEPLRRQGMGAQLLLAAEEEARKSGAYIALADARDWNADFFRKLGYTVYCTLENDPQGYRKYRMQKTL